MKTTTAFTISLGVLLAGMVFTAFFDSTPYVAFATAVSGCFTALATKKLIQKRSNFYNEANHGQEKDS